MGCFLLGWGKERIQERERVEGLNQNLGDNLVRFERGRVFVPFTSVW